MKTYSILLKRNLNTQTHKNVVLKIFEAVSSPLMSNFEDDLRMWWHDQHPPKEIETDIFWNISEYDFHKQS